MGSSCRLIVRPDLATTYSYTKNDVLITSPSPVMQKQLEYNALGQLTSVCEITATGQGSGTCAQTNPQNGYWTKYSYSPLYLSTVTQNAQSPSNQTRSFGPYKVCRGSRPVTMPMEIC